MKAVASILFLAVLITIGFYEPKLLLIVPFAMLVGELNYQAIDNVGKWWHRIQYFTLLLIGVSMVYFGLIGWDAFLLVTSIYYAIFEVYLNVRRGKDWNYVGYTSFLDRNIRNLFENEASVKLFFVVSKWLMIFITFGIWISKY